MDQKFYQKLRASTFILAMMLLSACSSSQVEENGAPPVETAAGANPGEATTDAVPPPSDPNAAPVVEDPSLAPSAPEIKSADAPPAVEDPTMASAPAPLTAPPATDPATDIPKSVAASATGMNDPLMSGIGDPAPVAEAPVKKGKHKKGRKGAMAASGAPGNYTVQKGDTLMKIAFEQYGDLYRWKEILEANRDRIQDSNNVPPGTQLNLNGAGAVTIERNGERYLIKHGDTLGKISNGVYGTPRKWKRLWENNRQLIKDPNKIYAGFYLFYQPEGKLTDGNRSGDDSASVPKGVKASVAATAPKADAPRSPASVAPASVGPMAPPK